MKNGRSIETPLFQTTRTRFFLQGFYKKQNRKDLPVSLTRMSCLASCGDLSLSTPLNHHLEKLKEAAETMVDSEFAELDAWLESCSEEKLN